MSCLTTIAMVISGEIVITMCHQASTIMVTTMLGSDLRVDHHPAQPTFTNPSPTYQPQPFLSLNRHLQSLNRHQPTFTNQPEPNQPQPLRSLDQPEPTTTHPASRSPEAAQPPPHRCPQPWASQCWRSAGPCEVTTPRWASRCRPGRARSCATDGAGVVEVTNGCH